MSLTMLIFASKEGPGHEGAKPQRAIFAKFDRVFVTGFSRMSERQYGIWDQVFLL